MKKALVIPVPHNNKPVVIALGDNELKTYHKEIGCDCIDICHLWRNSEVFIDAVVSDCGAIDGTKVNERFYMAYRDHLCNYPLYGIVIITMTDIKSGDTLDLDLNLAKNILMSYYGFSDEDFWNLGIQ